MTREEFQKIIESITNIKGCEYIKNTWFIGGITGNSAWNGNVDETIQPDEKPNFKILNLILEKVCPSISYLKYMKLTEELIIGTFYEYGYSDYYGNYENYATEEINCDKLYNFLIENKLMEI